MIITITLTILWIAVIVAGVLAIVKGFKNQTVNDINKEEKDKIKIYGYVLTGVGVVGLMTTLYMWWFGHQLSGYGGNEVSSKTNFGFRFY